ncbi:MAG: hypothetical protein WCA30_09865 [Dermatophilaceae bacterium]
MPTSMEQAVALGAYAGTVLLPVAKEHADEGTYRVISGLVTELWAGLPLVHDQSYADEGLAERPHENTTTARACADTGEQPESPSDIVLDVLDMVRTFWQLARSGSAEELADVASFRLGEIAAGLDHVYAVRHSVPDAERPGTFESVVLDCLEVVEAQRSSTVIRAMGDRDLYDHAMTIGGHLAECLEQGSPCRLFTTRQLDTLGFQVAMLLTASGFEVVGEDDTHHPGARVEVVDDVDLMQRCVAIHWHTGNVLRQRCSDAVITGDYDAEALLRAGAICQEMGKALVRILTAAGFEARINEDFGAHYVVVTGLRQTEDFESFVGVTRD